MYRIEATIEGVAPVLFSRWVTDLEATVTGKKMTKEERDAEATEKVYRDDDGLYFPAWNLKRAIVDGTKAAGLKDGRKSLAPAVMASVFPEREPRFGVTMYDFMHEATGRRPAKTGGACIIRRPALDTGWRLSFVLNVVIPTMHPDAIRASVETAGLMVGIGSWRPEYGRFVLAEWTVKE